MKKNRVVALLGLLGVFLSSGLKSSGMENNNFGNRNDGNDSAFFSNIWNCWPIPAIFVGGYGLKKLLGSGNEEIGYDDVDCSNSKYTQNFFIQRHMGSTLVLTPGDQKWISENVILLSQPKSSSTCWHDASVNYICAPGNINMDEKELPKEIKNILEWHHNEVKKANEGVNSCNFNERLQKCVEFPQHLRIAPDGHDSWLKDLDDISKNHGQTFMFNDSAMFRGMLGDGSPKICGVSVNLLTTNINSEKVGDISKELDDQGADRAVKARVMVPTKGFILSFNSPEADKEVLWFHPNNYYPTCVVANHRAGHYVTIFFVYDANMEIKFCVYLDGNDGDPDERTREIKIFSYTDLVELLDNIVINPTLGAKCGSYHVRYSTKDIVEKYYTSKG